MKAFITTDGRLTVVPEDETEDFALRAWLKRFPTFQEQAQTIAEPTSLQIDSYVKH